MRTSEIVRALEAGLITATEAVEQAMADSLDDLYERAASETPTWGRAADQARLPLRR
ncbi:hypothetical protein [Antarcticirhabdus aurantiaca]|uniref:Uncharacterized protein n=1 Tax=Antarcticirhabdus aurantiaca TaxID=2606717 RepID=A0ACD4NL45_9HYPH|nr:hypothetical protein [Antarcticirhabdus aurantiaca]WAJ27486.1 hypothetical protein OXU80_21975 [Jeongeuplla avenae]